MKVLVVGGAGYIGGAVTDELIKAGIDFTVYDNLTYEDHYLKPVDFIYGDIRDTEKLGALLPQYTHVIWLAALVGDPACSINPELTKQINQDAVEWLAENYNGRIFFASTCSVYGASDEPVAETSPINPLSVYASTKLAAEKFLENKNALIFRFGTVYGVSDTYSRIRMDLAVNIMTMNALEKGYLNVFGGTQWRPFIHVKDIGRFIVKTLGTDHRGIYNINTSNSNISDLARKISAVTGCEIRMTDQKFQDNRNYNANMDKAIRDGIIEPTTEFDISYGIHEIKNLVQSRRINNLESDQYSNVKKLNQKIKDYTNRAINKSEVAGQEVVLSREVELIDGGLAIDDRGRLTFANTFNFAGVKRFYQVENFSQNTVRAWHGHKQEGKYVYVAAGSAIIAVVPFDHDTVPSRNNRMKRYILSSQKPQILYIPPGYANGFKALENETKIIFFSTSTLDESKEDDFRFPADYWGRDIWEVENR